MASLYSLERPGYNDNASNMKGLVREAFEAFPSKVYGAIGRWWIGRPHRHDGIVDPQPTEVAFIVRLFVLSAAQC